MSSISFCISRATQSHVSTLISKFSFLHEISSLQPISLQWVVKIYRLRALWRVLVKLSILNYALQIEKNKNRKLLFENDAQSLAKDSFSPQKKNSSSLKANFWFRLLKVPSLFLYSYWWRRWSFKSAKSLFSLNKDFAVQILQRSLLEKLRECFEGIVDLLWIIRMEGKIFEYWTFSKFLHPLIIKFKFMLRVNLCFLFKVEIFKTLITM